MKDQLYQLSVLRRRQEAGDRAAGGSAADDRSAPAPAGPRFGVGEIVTNTGGGAYTITEQWWDPSGSGQWSDATAPLGYVQVVARDYLERDTGVTGDFVRFWEQRATGGAMEVIIDVGGTDGDEQESVSEHAGLALAEARWYDVKDEGTGTITLSSADWRGRLLMYHAAWETEPISRPLANTEDGTFVLYGVAATKVTIVSKSIGGDLADLYVDGTDGGKLKIDLTDNGNYGHFAFLVQATDDIEPADS